MIIEVNMMNGTTIKFKPGNLKKTVVDADTFITAYELGDLAKGQFALIETKAGKVYALNKAQISEVVTYVG